MKKTGGVLLLFLLLWPFVLEAQPKLRTVSQVINGGMIELDGGEIVRLIGVQAPTFPKDGKPKSAAAGWARRSQEFTQSLVQNRKVWLEYGKVRTDSEGRTWAYVFFKVPAGQTLGAGGETFYATSGTYMVNRLIIRYGMATSGNPFNFKYRSQFKQLEMDARRSQIGLFQSNF